jgi:hypothetical protein
LVWRQGLAAPRTAVIRGRDGPTQEVPTAAARPPALPSREQEILTDLAPIPAPRIATPPGGVPLGNTGEHAAVHHAFVSAELIALPPELPPVVEAPKKNGPTRFVGALAAAMLLGFGAWTLFGRSGKEPAATATTPALPAPTVETEVAPTPTRPAEAPPALVAALEPREVEKPVAPQKEKRRPARATPAPRLPRPEPKPPLERKLNGKPVVLEYDAGPKSFKNLTLSRTR